MALDSRLRVASSIPDRRNVGQQLYPSSSHPRAYMQVAVV